MRDVRVTALADKDETCRRQAAHRLPEAACFADFADALSATELDAVVITLPNMLHVAAAVGALQRGLHVYLEKPLATDRFGGREVVTAWRAARTVGMIGYNYRFFLPYQRAHDLIERGQIGPIVALRSIFCTSRRAIPEWKQRRDSGGGALLDLASHHLDLAAWLVGTAPRSVACDLLSRQTDDDTALVQLEFPGGIPAQIFAAFGGPELHRFEVLGERGRLLVDPYASDILEIRPATLDRVRLDRFLGAARALVSPGYWMRKAAGAHQHTSYRHALERFVDGAIGGFQPQPDLAAGLATLTWIDAARESARDKRKTVVVETFCHEGAAG
jgi:myo-inositol 2-dehydrogenase/D-chiro-inositol 1-dehydrogenase